MNLEQIIGGANLCGVIQSTVTGIPDVFPAAFYANRRPVDGDTGEYTKVTGTRKTARIAAYGSPSQVRDLKDIAKTPVKLIHTVESINHKPSTLTNLYAYNDLAKQRLGIQEVTRQTREFKQLFDNLRVAALTSALFKGVIYFDANGNLLPSSTGAVVTIDFGVPAGNKNQIGGIISASWNTAGTKIVTQIAQIKKQARKLSGYPLKHAFYGENILDYLLTNTQVKELINRTPGFQQAALQGEIPQGLFGFTWHPAYEAFFEDASGTNQDLADANGLVLTPEPTLDVLEWLEGSYPVPTTVGAVTADGAAAMPSVQVANGMFSYGQVISDPVTVKHVAGDTFLPVWKVPKALFQLVVHGF